MFYCPECGATDVSVRESRPHVSGRRRRYHCGAGHRFTSIEIVVRPNQAVVLQANGSGRVTCQPFGPWLNWCVERATATLRETFR